MPAWDFHIRVCLSTATPCSSAVPAAVARTPSVAYKHVDGLQIEVENVSTATHAGSWTTRR